jgi:hypothetical protein
MGFIKSNSALVGFDRSWLYDDVLDDAFDFLSFVQKINLSLETNKTNLKFIGNENTIKNQFVKPEVNLQIDYFQTIDFANEKKFGLSMIQGTSLDRPYCFNDLIKKNFYTKKAFVLFDNEEFSDVLFKIKNQGFNSSMMAMSLNNVFLNSLSFAYKIREIPLVSTSFSTSNMLIQNLSNSNKINFPDSTSFSVPQKSVDDLILQTQTKNSEVLIYVMKNISVENSFSSLNFPGPNINSFLSGVIQSMDFSVSLNRNKFYFFENGNDPADRRIIPPIGGSLRISGISNTFTTGNLNNFFNTDSTFSITVSIAGKYGGTVYPKITDLKINGLCIDSFDYTIDLNGLLNYTLTCSFENTTTSGLSLVSYDTIDYLSNVLKSFDGQFILSSDGEYLASFVNQS